MNDRTLILGLVLLAALGCQPGHQGTDIQEPTIPEYLWPSIDRPIAGARAVQSSPDAAVIVAIESYWFLPEITGALRNAAAWYGYFTETLDIPTTRVHRLRNEEASVEAIRKALTEAAEEAQAGGRVWFVFIGHGAPEGEHHAGLLLGADAIRTPDSFKNRGLLHEEAVSILENQSEAQPIIVFDACFSGVDTEGKSLLDNMMPAELAVFEDPKRAVILSATNSGQRAGDLPGLTRPAFSYLLLGALRGWAEDKNNDNQISVEEAVYFADGVIRSVVNGRSQNPQFYGTGRQILGAAGPESGPNISAIARALTLGEFSDFAPGVAPSRPHLPSAPGVAPSRPHLPSVAAHREEGPSSVQPSDPEFRFSADFPTESFEVQRPKKTKKSDMDNDGLIDSEDQCPGEPETDNGYQDEDGCPDAVPREVVQFSGVIRGITFDNDRDTIRTSSMRTLDKAVIALKQDPDIRIQISGHTDSTGNRRHNLDLSARRAEAVKRYFIEKGIDANRIETRGYGPDRPIDTNSTRAGRANNRRIEFSIID